MPKIPISLQLYSLREETKADFARTVNAVAGLGYTGVELAGYGNLEAAAAAQAVADAGLKVSGMHVGIGALRADIGKVINEALLFATRDVIVPSWPKAQFCSAAACEQIGEELDAFGARLRAFGLRLGFHNHAAELALIDGRPVFDWMLGAAAPRHLCAEVDVYWVHVGGLCPATFLRRHGARVPLIHLKDETELGLGPVDFPAVFAAVESVGAAEWYVVEQEKYHHTPLESVRLCFEQLRHWGRA